MFNIVWKQPDGTFAVTISADQEKGFAVPGKVDEVIETSTPTLEDDPDNEGKQKIVMVVTTETIQVDGTVYEDSTTHAETMQTKGNIPAEWVVIGINMSDLTPYLPPSN